MNNLFASKLYKYLLQIFLVSSFIVTVKPAFYGQKSGSKTSHINFIEDSFTEALKQGKAQNKYIFVDAYATWCGPCKMLKSKTFTDEKAAAFYNSNFINVSIDMEKGEGPALAARWQLQAYPTLIIFNPDGKPVLGSVGFIGAADLIRFGKQALSK
jgi:thiol:disulfide interchange protein